MKLFISGLLLLTFGFTLGSEAFGDSHIVVCEAGASVSGIESPSHVDSVQRDSKKPSPEKHAANCADPCHMGQGHFGHCAFVSGVSEVKILVADLTIVSHAISQASAENAVLDGLRRPPRFS